MVYFLEKGYMMIHFKLKMIFRNIGHGFRSNRLLLFLYMLYSMVAVFLCLLQNNKAALLYNIEVCRYDAFVSVNYYLFFILAIALTSVFIVMNLVKQDYRSICIMRYENKSILYLHQVCKTVIFLLLLSAYLTVITWICGAIVSPRPLNWNQENSWYFFYNRTGSNQTSGLPIVAAFFIDTFLLLAGINLLAITVRWITGNFYSAWLIVAVVCLLNVRKTIITFFSANSIWYTNWNRTGTIAWIYLIPMLCIAVLIGIGIAAAKRKDFIDAEKK